MALNIADLAEHAIDAVPDRVALICGDEQITYVQLEEKANRLAHYLIDHGVRKGDKVGLYCRNRIEIVIAMLGIVKAGAILVNVNYRYVEGELRYLFDNSDMVALVHERQYADRVSAVLPEVPNVRTVLVVDDGSEKDYRRYGGVEFNEALAQGSPERDFGERSADDIYLLYTGGTTGFPKGVMWRHEDIYRVLLGGTDFATGEFVQDEYAHAKQAAAGPPMAPRLRVPKLSRMKSTVSGAVARKVMPKTIAKIITERGDWFTATRPNTATRATKLAIAGAMGPDLSPQPPETITPIRPTTPMAASRLPAI